MEKQFITNSPSETKKLAQQLLKDFLKIKSKKALILGLEGDLGGGKTTFLQGLSKGLGIKEKILSPTFIIIRKFPIPFSKFKNFYHIDCYRIQKKKEVFNLHFKEIISNPENIVTIEWVDKIKKFLPKKILILKFEFLNKNQRRITIKNFYER